MMPETPRLAVEAIDRRRVGSFPEMLSRHPSHPGRSARDSAQHEPVRLPIVRSRTVSQNLADTSAGQPGLPLHGAPRDRS